MNDRVDRLTEAARHLTPQERVELLDRLWDMFPIDEGTLPLPIGHLEEIDRRLGAHRLDPENVATWDEVKARLADRTRA